MTSSGLTSEVLNGPERRRRRTPGERLANRGGDPRAWRHGQLGGTPARHRAEPVVPLAAAGVSGRIDGDAIGRAGGPRFRVPIAAGAGPRLAAAAGQEDDGSGDPQGSSRVLRGLKKTSIAVAV